MRTTDSYGAEPPALRGDAARNARRIIEAGRAVLRDNPEASAEDIAQAAGVGIATLYRRFSNRPILVRAILWDIFETDIGPALERAENEADPREGIRIAFEGTLGVALPAGTSFLSNVTPELAEAFLEPLQRLLARGQQQGVIRADISPREDTLRLALMLISIIPTFDPEGEGWRRYLRLITDSLETTQAALLPPAERVVNPFTG